MKYDIEIKVYVLKSKGLNNSASVNRHEMIIRMTEKSFDTIIIEREFFRQAKTIKKILYGLIFRIKLGILASKIPNSEKNKKNIIILFSIDPLTALIVKTISIFKDNKLIIERNEFLTAIRKKKPFKRFFYEYFILSWQYKLYNGLFLMTDELINFYKKYTRKDCSIQKLPMTVDFSRFENNRDKDFEEKYIAYIGSLSNEKDGVFYLIKAFEKIANNHKDIKLKIAGGKDDEVSRLKKHVDHLGLTHRIECMGLVNRELIPSFLQNAMILVLPRPDSKQARGGFPTKLGEYLASSKPVIITRVGEIASYLDEEDVYFINPDKMEEELANTIQIIITDYKHAIKVGKKGRQKALKYFSLEANAEKVANLINTVANN